MRLLFLCKKNKKEDKENKIMKKKKKIADGQ